MPRKPTNHLTPDQLLKKIRQSAKYAASVGQTCYDKEILKAKKGYTDDQADVYIAVFNENAGTPQEQAIRKARHAAQMAAGKGALCLTKEALLKKGYSEQASEAYLAAYKESKGSDEEQAIRQARRAAQLVAMHGAPCPTKEVLLKKGYTEQTSEAYLAAYKKTNGTDEDQAIRKARRAAQVAAGQGTPCPTKEALLKKGYSEQASEIYLAAYKESKGTDEEQAIRKASYVARLAVSRGTPCPTKEALLKKGYTEQTSEAYLATYEKSKNAKNARLTREQELQQLQNQLNQSNEKNDYSCFASLIDSLGYQEDTSSSLTEQEEQYLAEVLEEESANNLFFNFNSAETTSLTASGFLSSLDEVDRKDASVEIYHLR
ncbi:hypothetical protein [Candidatus Berkiella aquae]|uniref:Uncharacterized protein n=1 Tax=Candidatus Berkiella aquae TaxID=295108 RepID=A0A0Q9YZ36_9GAMM|nr:hypothetical protein [Candidatus Berkiella aquae]MCS5711391.1 hypothetical protein [Candidatus Berkiella aquae]